MGGSAEDEVVALAGPVSDLIQVAQLPHRRLQGLLPALGSAGDGLCVRRRPVPGPFCRVDVSDGALDLLEGEGVLWRVVRGPALNHSADLLAGVVQREVGRHRSRRDRLRLWGLVELPGGAGREGCASALVAEAVVDAGDDALDLGELTVRVVREEGLANAADEADRDISQLGLSQQVGDRQVVRDGQGLFCDE